MAGLLDFFDSDNAQLGLGLLAAAGARSDGANFGQRLLEGVNHAQSWKQQKKKDEYAKSLMEMQQFEMEQKRLEAKQAQEDRASALAKRNALSGLFSPAQQASQAIPAAPVDAFLPPEMRTGASAMLPATPARQAMPAGIDIQRALAAGYTADEIMKLDGLRNAGQNKVARTIKGMGADGKEYEYQVDEMGRKVGEGFGQWKAPILNDGGGQTNVLDPYNPLKQLGSIPKTMTFADKNAAGNLSITRARLAFDQGNQVTESGGPSQVQFTKQFGKAEPGFRWKADGTAEAIPGGSKDIRAGELGAKREKQQAGAIAQADRLINKVDQAMGKVGYNTAGAGGAAMGWVAGSEATDLESDLETIKANLGFAELQAMRDASPTGGALGQVAVQELVALQSTIASLNRKQSPSQLRERLKEVKTHYANWRDAVVQANASPDDQTQKPPKPLLNVPTGGLGSGTFKIISVE